MQLRDGWQQFQRANLGVVAIGQGSAARSKRFQQELDIPFPLLSDPRRTAYNAYGLARFNLRREASLTTVRRGLQAVAAHSVARSRDQDMLQLGGVFVVDTNGIVRYARPQQRMSDVPTNDELLAVVK